MCLDPVAAVDLTLVPANNIQLPCQIRSNLAQVFWRFSEQTLHSNHKYYIYSGGLLILGASESDAGLYTCNAVEQVKGRTYNRTVAVYRLQPYSDPGVDGSVAPGTEATNSSDAIHEHNTTAPGLGPVQGSGEPSAPETRSNTGRVAHLEVAVGLLSLLCLSLMGAVFWIWSQGHRGCFKFAQRPSENEGKRQSAEYMHIQNRTSVMKLLKPDSERPCSANNNHNAVDFKRNGERHFASRAKISSLDGLGYINDESEI